MNAVSDIRNERTSAQREFPPPADGVERVGRCGCAMGRGQIRLGPVDIPLLLSCSHYPGEELDRREVEPTRRAAQQANEV